MSYHSLALPAMHQLIKESKNIAIIGLSDNPERASYKVASYLQNQGFNVIPINPVLNGKEVLGQPSHSTLIEAIRATGTPIDIVNVFRASDAVSGIVDELLVCGQKPLPALWLQLDVIASEDTEKRALEAGVQVVQDRCLKIEHSSM